MRPLTQQNLGIVIAYLMPGFLCLWPLGGYSPDVRAWLTGPEDSGPTVAGFCYVTLASLALGLLTNMTRAVLLDPIHHRTGIRKREWTYQTLQQNLAAIEFLVSNQFRYYQFAGNMLVGVIFAYAVYQGKAPWSWGLLCGAALTALLLWFGSRSTLRTYYLRLGEVLAPVPEGRIKVVSSEGQYSPEIVVGGDSGSLSPKLVRSGV